MRFFGVYYEYDLSISYPVKNWQNLFSAKQLSKCSNNYIKNKSKFFALLWLRESVKCVGGKLPETLYVYVFCITYMFIANIKIIQVHCYI